MSDTTLPLVSIITIDFNTPDFTLALISSLELSNYQNWELIIVDNGTTDEARQKLDGINSKVNYIKSDKNSGFAGGNNLGISHSKGDFLFFINNDTEVSKYLIGQLITRLQENHQIGLISPKIIFHNTNIIQYAGYTELSFTIRNKAIGNKKEDGKEFNAFCQTASAHGAAMMMRRDVLNIVGEIPEVYFLYYEEMDWCEIVKKAGFEIWVDQNAIIYHKESMSIGKSNPLKTYYLTRNRILYSLRNNMFLQNALFIIYSYFIVLPVKCIRFLMNREWKHLKSYISAHLWHIKRVFNG